MKDPTEAALSAIQDALNLRDGEPTPPPNTTGGPVSATLAVADPWPRARAGDQDLFEETGPRIAGQSQSARRAANDDRRSIGQLLQTLQQRPPNTPYLIALGFAILWIGVGAFIATGSFAELREVLATGGRATAGPQLLGLASAVLVPPLFFFVLAHIVSRVQELRGISRSMTEVAIRLAEPETIASESIVSVGQAIRREVAAMGDGVERALARAAELETLVHNEVAALERAYNDNELRIRGLIEDLASQRESLIGQADQIRSAITSVHMGMTQDITSVSEMVSSSVNEASQRITRSLADKGEHITVALGRAGDSMIDAIGDRGAELLDQLNRTSDEVSRTLDAANTRLVAALNFKTDELTDKIVDISGDLSQTLSARLDRIADGLEEKTAILSEKLSHSTEDAGGKLLALTSDLTDQLTARSREVVETLIDTGSRMAETLVTRADEVNATIKASGESLALDLSLRGSDLVSKLEEAGTRINDTILSRGSTVTATFETKADELAEVINRRTEDVQQV
ncbi:MAG TPA: hypothetical protein VGD36_13710, partial [Xanthobacteraceae bacterium]